MDSKRRLVESLPPHALTGCSNSDRYKMTIIFFLNLVWSLPNFNVVAIWTPYLETFYPRARPVIQDRTIGKSTRSNFTFSSPCVECKEESELQLTPIQESILWRILIIASVFPSVCVRLPSSYIFTFTTENVNQIERRRESDAWHLSDVSLSCISSDHQPRFDRKPLFGSDPVIIGMVENTYHSLEVLPNTYTYAPPMDRGLDFVLLRVSLICIT